MATTDKASRTSPGAPLTVELDELIARLDLSAKVALLTGATMFTLLGNEEIGLAPMAFSDGPTGVRGLKFTGGEAVALFPNATLLAASWDEDAAYEVGQIVADEAQRQHIHVVLGPTINLHRSPLGGRLFEAYSEDPLLTGRIAAGYVRGVQAAGVGACLKHLVANEAETLRNSVDNQVSSKALRELYLLPFEIAVEESDAWTLMAAYNDVNGVAATEHDEIVNGIVKGEWGYSGLVMSDWFATKTTVPSVLGGLDLVMPGPDGPWGQALVDAVTDGEVPEAVVVDHLRRLLRLAAHVDALGTPRSWPTAVEQPDAPVRQEQLRRLAAAGMTVLTNDGTLPLAPAATVALIGRPGVDTVTMGGGSAQVNPPYSVTIAEGLQALVGDRLTVVDGVDVRTRPVAAGPAHLVDPVTGEPGVRMTVEDGHGVVLDERHSPIAQTMVGFDDDFGGTAALVRFRARAAGGAGVSGGGGAVRLQVGVIGLGAWTLTAGAQTFTTTLRPATADPAEGVLNPPTWDVEVEVEPSAVIEGVADLLRVETTGGLDHARLLGLVARPAPTPVADVLVEAARAAAAADVAVVVVGLSAEQETEAADKTTLALPGRQDDLVRAVAAVARRTVVLINAATPVLTPWLDDVDAVLVIGLPGQEGGHAVAAALLGDLEPSGRLVTSYPVADGASPAWTVEPTAGVLAYTEGTHIGYRGYAAGLAQPPAFWFGHGLGYGTWDYSAPALVGEDAVVAVSVAVTNTGSRRSREVVQVYLDPVEADEPVRLVGWSAVTVAPGDTVEVRVVGDPRLWRRWDETTGQWGTLAAGGDLLVARGLGDVRGRVALA
ncbi:MAG: glycoside hydrolase family 3 C-terminal domain-containing protein [Lapillicoccus sp.]